LSAPNSTVSRAIPHRYYSRAIFFAFCLAAVILAWHYLAAFQWKIFSETLAVLDARWILAGISLALLSYFGRAARWKVMMLPAQSNLWRLFSATLIGFSAVVLFGRPGELVRPMLIARRERSAYPTQAAIWLLERLYDLLLILLLFGIGLAQVDALGIPAHSRLTPVIRLGGGLITAAAGAAAGVLYLLARHPEKCRSQIMGAVSFLPPRLFGRLARTLDSFLEGARSMANPRVFASSLALTVSEWAIILGTVWSYFQSHPQTRGLPFLDSAVYLGFVTIGNIVQLPGIGGGVQIASIIVLTELFHVPFEVATGLSLLIWAGTALIVLPAGLPLALAGHVKLSDFRKKMTGTGEESGNGGMAL
jgi:hypothetical protein